MENKSIHVAGTYLKEMGSPESPRPSEAMGRMRQLRGRFHGPSRTPGWNHLRVLFKANLRMREGMYTCKAFANARFRDF